MKITAIITNVRDTFAFGITPDTYEQVYIPASITRRFELELDEEVELAVVPNTRDTTGAVPWFAVHLVEEEEEPEPVAPPAPPAPPKLDIKDAVYNIVCATDRVFTTGDIAKDLDTKHGTEHTPENISAYLDSLHIAGKVARAAVNQTKSDYAKYSLWARELNLFKNLC